MRTWTHWCAGLAGLLPLLAGAGHGSAGVAKTVVWTGAGGNDHSYQLVLDGASSWSAAERAASASGGHLVAIDAADEQALVEKFLSTSDAGSGSYWFGLRETADEGEYRAVTGGVEPLGYTHWFPGEANNLNGNESSGALLWSNEGDPTFDRRGFWNDLPDAGGYPPVAATFPDLVSAGYLVEYNTRLAGAFELDLDDGEVGQPGGNPATSIPLPAGLSLVPAGAAVAMLAARRLGRRG